MLRITVQATILFVLCFLLSCKVEKSAVISERPVVKEVDNSSKPIDVSDEVEREILLQLKQIDPIQSSENIKVEFKPTLESENVDDLSFENLFISYFCYFDTVDDGKVLAGVANDCSSLPNAGFDHTGFAWTPDYSQAGTYFFLIVGENLAGARGVMDFSIEILDSDRGPDISHLKTFYSQESGETLAFDVNDEKSGDDSDIDGDKITYECNQLEEEPSPENHRDNRPRTACNDFMGITFDANGVFSWAVPDPVDPGRLEYFFEIVASSKGVDGIEELKDSKEFRVTVDRHMLLTTVDNQLGLLENTPIAVVDIDDVRGRQVEKDLEKDLTVDKEIAIAMGARAAIPLDLAALATEVETANVAVADATTDEVDTAALLDTAKINVANAAPEDLDAAEAAEATAQSDYDTALVAQVEAVKAFTLKMAEELVAKEQAAGQVLFDANALVVTETSDELIAARESLSTASVTFELAEFTLEMAESELVTAKRLVERATPEQLPGALTREEAAEEAVAEAVTALDEATVSITTAEEAIVEATSDELKAALAAQEIAEEALPTLVLENKTLMADQALATEPVTSKMTVRADEMVQARLDELAIVDQRITDNTSDLLIAAQKTLDNAIEADEQAVADKLQAAQALSTAETNLVIADANRASLTDQEYAAIVAARDSADTLNNIAIAEQLLTAQEVIDAEALVDSHTTDALRTARDDRVVAMNNYHDAMLVKEKIIQDIKAIETAYEQAKMNQFTAAETIVDDAMIQADTAVQDAEEDVFEAYQAVVDAVTPEEILAAEELETNALEALELAQTARAELAESFAPVSTATSVINNYEDELSDASRRDRDIDGDNITYECFVDLVIDDAVDDTATCSTIGINVGNTRSNPGIIECGQDPGYEGLISPKGRLDAPVGTKYFNTVSKICYEKVADSVQDEFAWNIDSVTYDGSYCPYTASGESYPDHPSEGDIFLNINNGFCSVHDGSMWRYQYTVLVNDFNTDSGVLRWHPAYGASGVFEFKIVGTAQPLDPNDEPIKQSRIFYVEVNNRDRAPKLADMRGHSKVIHELKPMPEIDINTTTGSDKDEDGDTITYSCYYDTEVRYDPYADPPVPNPNDPDEPEVVAPVNSCSDLEGLVFDSATGKLNWTPTFGAGRSSDELNYQFTIKGTAQGVEAEPVNPGQDIFLLRIKPKSFEGWKNVKVMGNKVYVDQAAIPPVDGSVSFSFEKMNLWGGEADYYNVYRRNEPASADPDADYVFVGDAPASGPDAETFMDPGPFVAGTIYYYKVVAVVGADEFDPPVGDDYGVDKELRIEFPPDNMVLMHRWMANKEMCERMGKPVDRLNNYRCDHNTFGRWESQPYFDVGHSLFVDMVEVGCNYSAVPKVSPESSACGGGSGCIGNSDPNGPLGLPGVTSTKHDVYYDRTSGQCYLNLDGGDTWLTNTEVSAMRCSPSPPANCRGASGDPGCVRSGPPNGQAPYVCNYSKSGCSGNPDGCKGSGNPTDGGFVGDAPGDVYYDSDTDPNMCYLYKTDPKTGTDIWQGPTPYLCDAAADMRGDRNPNRVKGEFGDFYKELVSGDCYINDGTAWNLLDKAEFPICPSKAIVDRGDPRGDSAELNQFFLNTYTNVCYQNIDGGTTWEAKFFQHDGLNCQQKGSGETHPSMRNIDFPQRLPGVKDQYYKQINVDTWLWPNSGDGDLFIRTGVAPTVLSGAPDDLYMQTDLEPVVLADQPNHHYKNIALNKCHWFNSVLWEEVDIAACVAGTPVGNFDPSELTSMCYIYDGGAWVEDPDIFHCLKGSRSGSVDPNAEGIPGNQDNVYLQTSGVTPWMLTDQASNLYKDINQDKCYSFNGTSWDEEADIATCVEGSPEADFDPMAVTSQCFIHDGASWVVDTNIFNCMPEVRTSFFNPNAVNFDCYEYTDPAWVKISTPDSCTANTLRSSYDPNNLTSKCFQHNGSVWVDVLDPGLCSDDPLVSPEDPNLIEGQIANEGDTYLDTLSGICYMSMNGIDEWEPQFVTLSLSDLTGDPQSYYYDKTGNKCYYNHTGGEVWTEVKNSCSHWINTCTNTGGSVSCSGSGSPIDAGDITGEEDKYYLDTGAKLCYKNVDGATGWVLSHAMEQVDTSLVKKMISNTPGLPPFARVSPVDSGALCGRMDPFDILSDGNAAIPRRLLSRVEWVLAAAWDDGLSDQDINLYEEGLNLDLNFYCNSSLGSGLDYDDNVSPGDLDTLPATLDSSRRTVRTGSLATNKCISRYGIQDMIGNVWEWNSDYVQSSSDKVQTPDFLYGIDTQFRFGYNGRSVSGALSGDFGSEVDVRRGFKFPFAIPAADNQINNVDGAVDYADNLEKFHGDYFWYDPSGTSYMRSGGGWYNADAAGRYSLAITGSAATQDPNIGFRCAIPAPVPTPVPTPDPAP